MYNKQDWIEVCEAYCKRIGATLLFVNNYDFGYEKDGNFAHIDAGQLADILGSKYNTHNKNNNEEVRND